MTVGEVEASRGRGGGGGRGVVRGRIVLAAPPGAHLQAVLALEVALQVSRSSLRFTSIESVMPSSHLILYCPLFLLPPIPPSIRVFSSESTLPSHEVAEVLEFQL